MQSNTDLPDAPTFLSTDRLASLSDTIFGVAMTLVATTLLPYFSNHKGLPVEQWSDLSRDLVAVVFSFAISARYWVSQQQRLAMTKTVGPRETLLNMLFLFLIVLLPISTSVSDLVGWEAKPATIILYGTHLVLIGVVHLLLWIEAHRSARARLQIVGSSFVLAIFILGTLAGMIIPFLAVFVWMLAFLSEPTSRILTARIYRV